ncbi:MAG: LPS assembly protein LptD [Sulfurimonas sp.]|nr:LPS assembly protein LptD [Sulfurimonas sp.]
MYKLLFLILTITGVLYSNEIETQNDKVEIFATKMNSSKEIVHASGGVAVVYKDYYLTASRAIYDKTSGDLELFHNIRANQGSSYKVLGNYAKLNIKNKERSFQPFYMLDEDSKVWISADRGDAKDKELKISSGVVSGCEPENPLWQMEFSSSEYNTDDKWLDLYNARLYFYDIPILYTPWFGHSLDKTRRTGLLRPSFGYSGDEGFYYQQPIYIAEQNWWDLEFNPQIRTNRGKGIYSTFRFIDSKVSEGSFTTGYFKENDDYFVENKLKNETHYGYNFKYENSDFINQWFGLNLDGQSGIYADIGYMNDVDYINLVSNDTINKSTATQMISRINMFYNTDTDYFGAYFKYYQNLNENDIEAPELNNDKTLQNIPTLHYHHYIETLLDQHLTYNIDIQSQNFYRKVGSKVIQTNLNVPVSLHTTLFDEYLDISFKTNLYAQHSKFSGQNENTLAEYEDGYIGKFDNILSVSTQLTKAYTDFSHVISFGTSYHFDGAETTNGFYEYNEDFCANPLNANNDRCEFYNITETQEELKFDFTQYIYDAAGKQILYHRIAQQILFNEDTVMGDLENEVDYSVTDSINVYNNIFYNYDENKFSKIYTRLSYDGYGFNIALSHLYKDTFLDSREATATLAAYTPYTNYVTATVRYTYDSHYSYHAAYDYDIELEIKKRAELGFLYSKRCWDFGITYAENNRPELGEDGITNNYEKYIYFTLALKPFMQSGGEPFFAFKLPEDDND